jgi:signal peptide peptidase SppA
MSAIIIGIMSTTSYAQYFTTNFAQAAKQYVPQAEYRVVDRPDEREQAREEIEELVLEDDINSEDDEWGSYGEPYDVIAENGCNVLGLSIYGEIGTDYGYTSANYFRDALELNRGDERIKAIIVDVDSEGGSPTAGDEIRILLEEQKVPVIAQVRELAASAAYMAILSADKIYAHRYGSVGSIGVIISHYDYTQYNAKEGIKYSPIMTGSFKDLGSPDRELTAEERAILQDQIDYIYEDFVKDVAASRNISYEKVKQIANGTTYMAHEAKALGLIDEVGGRKEVMEYLKKTINEEPVICWQ